MSRPKTWTRTTWLLRFAVVAIAAGVYIWTLPGAFGLGGSSSTGGYPYPYPYPPLPGNRVPVCHKGQTIDVAPEAVAAHLAHGDTLGPCP